MPEFNIYIAISVLSGLIILSYIFSIINIKTRIPTVLMLLFLGIAIRETLLYFDAYVEIPLDFIQFFGVLGLILILLEAGLDLNMSRKKLPLIKRATASSVFVLALSVIGIASIVHFALDQSWWISVVYSVPLSVISSTIVASSIYYLGENKREFLTYESSLSDILGILLFNFLIAGQAFSFGLITINFVSIILSLIISVFVSILLVFLLAKVNINIKAFLIFAVLLLVYSIGHLWQLPTLLVVLVFGLIINNWRNSRFKNIRKILKTDDVDRATETIKSVTSESAFLIRTLFFTLFGYMIDVRVLGDSRVVLVGTAIVIVIFLVRYLYLRIFMSQHILPELFFAPRGLVTIVLFYSIPSGLKFDNFDDGILFYVVVLTTLIMMLGSMWFTPKNATRESESSRRRGLGYFLQH